MLEIKRSIGRGFPGTPGGLFDILTQLQNMALLTPTEVYFVSKGGNNTTGKSWKTAFTTLTAAITAQRAMRADLPSAEQSVTAYIIMAAGLYDENITTLPFSTKIIGLGQLGTDKATEIYPTTGACMAGTVSGLGLYNIRFEHRAGAVDCMDFNILHNSIIDGCEFVTGTNDAVNALSTQTCQNTIIRNCRTYDQSNTTFEKGFYFGGGADKYLQGCLIENNFISGLDAAGKGIHIQSTCTVSATILRNNIVRLTGAGVGIDDDSNGAILIQNKIFTIAGAGFDANEDLAIDNIWNNGTATVDYPNLT